MHFKFIFLSKTIFKEIFAHMVFCPHCFHILKSSTTFKNFKHKKNTTDTFSSDKTQLNLKIFHLNTQCVFHSIAFHPKVPLSFSKISQNTLARID